jgi:hypothetical protein
MHGALCFLEDNPKVAPWQYGIGTPAATAKMIDKGKQAILDRRAILAIDGKNAFNAAARVAVEAKLKNGNYPYMRQYFRLVYYRVVKLVAKIRQKDGRISPFLINMLEGYKQGDKGSGWLFCHGLEDPVDAVEQEKMAYFDDLYCLATRFHGSGQVPIGWGVDELLELFDALSSIHGTEILLQLTPTAVRFFNDVSFKAALAHHLQISENLIEAVVLSPKGVKVRLASTTLARSVLDWSSEKAAELCITEATLAPADPRSLASVGYFVNPPKCELYSPTGFTDAQRARASLAGIQLIDEMGALKMLGAPVGREDIPQAAEAMKSIINKKLDPTRQFLQRVKNRRLDARLAYTLEKMCGIPKANYLCSVVSPEIMKQFYDELDNLIIATFSHIHGIPEQHVKDHSHQALIELFAVKGPILYQKARNAVEGITSAPNANQPSSSTNLDLPVGPDATMNNFIASHRRSQEGNHAKTWMMYALPEHCINTEDFCTAMQLRMEYCRPVTSHCTCGHSLRHGGIEALSHLLTCPENLVSYNVRHEEIVSAIIKVLKAFGFSVQREPRQFSGPNDQKRPDLTVFLSRTSVVIDVTVVTNTAESWNTRADPAAAAANDKRAKHSDNVCQQGAYEFFPLSCESSGHIDPCFDTMIKTLCTELPLDTAKHFKRAMCFATSVALQRGNARILKHAYHRLREAATLGTLRWM